MMFLYQDLGASSGWQKKVDGICIKQARTEKDKTS
uniref:Uncharacterized protein n=1 Tax=Rhizophora mucronata TaxID=61149 RepID=A0A2P2KZU5_RHIMU